MSLLKGLFGASRRETLPIFPLRTVLFPGGRLPLRIFEVRYIDMARACLRESSPFGICLIREGEEVGAPAVPETVGCLARICDADIEEQGILKVQASGSERFRIQSREVSRQGLIVADVEMFEPESDALEAPGLVECAEFVRKAIIGIGPERFAEPFLFDDATWVGFRLAEILPLRMDLKQKLLELTDPTLRLGFLHRFLRDQKLIA